MASARTTFPAGIVLPGRKRQALGAPIILGTAPALARIALDQGTGEAAVPVVAPGQSVNMGSVIARAAAGLAGTLHAPVAGRVQSIARLPVASENGSGLCIVIENDGTDARDPDLQPAGELGSIAPETLIARLHEAGIAGLGGAAFPTAAKLTAARVRGARRLVLNGAECEPWICCDDALMREHAEDIVLGARVLMHALEAASATLAIEDDKPEAIAALRAALSGGAADAIQLVVVPTVYPAGAERPLVTAITGTEVPAGGLPADVGVTCQNVATAAAVARWYRTGDPNIDRIVTVTGGAVARPCNVRVRIGTPLRALVDAAGGYAGVPHRLIVGGSMTGRAVATDAIGVTKATNCVLVATHADLQTPAPAWPCIRCGDCAAVCPAGLLPQQLHRAARGDDLQSLERLGLGDCIECGCCDYVCPSRIPLTQQFRAARQAWRVREVEARRAAAARERFKQHELRVQAAAAAEQHEFTAARSRAQQEHQRQRRGDEHVDD